LDGFHGIPFTSSYLPGKSQAHMVFLAGLGLLLVATWIAPIELRAMADSAGTLRMLLILAAAAAFARWRTSAASKSKDAVLQFEEEMPPVILTLDLHPGNAPPAA